MLQVFAIITVAQAISDSGAVQRNPKHEQKYSNRLKSLGEPPGLRSLARSPFSTSTCILPPQLINLPVAYTMQYATGGVMAVKLCFSPVPSSALARKGDASFLHETCGNGSSSRDSDSCTRRRMKRSSSVPEIMMGSPPAPSLQARRGISSSQMSLPSDLARPAAMEGSPRRVVSKFVHAHFILTHSSPPPSYHLLFAVHLLLFILRLCVRTQLE